MVEVTVVDDHPTEEATIAEDLRPHIIEAVVVVVLEGIIVQDLGHIHPVVIERRQIEDDVVEILKNHYDNYTYNNKDF